jgi:hypothetical protein
MKWGMKYECCMSMRLVENGMECIVIVFLLFQGCGCQSNRTVNEGKRGIKRNSERTIPALLWSGASFGSVPNDTDQLSPLSKWS